MNFTHHSADQTDRQLGDNLAQQPNFKGQIITKGENVTSSCSDSNPESWKCSNQPSGIVRLNF